MNSELQKVERLVGRFRALGLLDHCTEDELRRGYEVASHLSRSEPFEILMCFPDTATDFDLELADNPGIYKHLTEELAAATHGAFVPEHIVDEYVPDGAAQFRYGFSCNGKRYDMMLTAHSDWLDTGFMDLIRQAVRENVEDGRFYDLVGDGGRMIFLNARQYEMVKEEQIFEFYPETEEEWEEWLKI